jgi:D-amino-acid dehydrogenase
MKVAVVGSGLIGLATGYELARRGAEVVVIGDRQPGSGASSNNAGWIVPAESGPVPAPGVVLETLRSMVKPDSPVYVRPSLSPSFIGFFLNMLRACTASAYDRSFAATVNLARGTMEGLDAWAADGMAFEMHAEGEVRAYLDPEGYRDATANLGRYERAGMRPEALSGDAARTAIPALGANVVGAVRFPDQRHVQPQEVVDALVGRLTANGGTLVRGRVTGAWALPSGGVELQGAFGAVHAEAVVIAAGVWSASVAKLLGSKLPVRPGKGYSLDYVPPQLAVGPSVYLAEAHCVVTPFEGGTRVAGTMEFGGLDEKVSKVRLRAIQLAPGGYLRTWNPDAPHLTPSAGLRPMMPDGIACIGRLRPFSNVYVATGHAMLGLTLAPKTSQLVADMILERADPAELKPFSPARFGA